MWSKAMAVIHTVGIFFASWSCFILEGEEVMLHLV